MTKSEAIVELTRCADLCPTTPLSKACQYAVAVLSKRQNCGTCKYAAGLTIDEPCRSCNFVYGDQWEPRGE